MTPPLRRRCRRCPTDVPDLERFAADVAARLERGRLGVRRRRTASSDPVFVARAPGRLDVMGGIADYSGALVLQWPIREATRVAVRPWRERRLSITSIGRGGARAPLRRAAGPGRRSASSATTTCVRGLPADPARHWAAYVAGVFHVLAREHGVQFRSRRRHSDRVRRPGGQGRQLFGGDRGGDDGGGASRVARVDRAEDARRSLPAGREPDRRRAVRRDGPDGVDLRRGRQSHGAAVPARRVPGQRAAARRTGRLGHRFGHPPRGHRRRLRRGARRRVHGLPDPRGRSPVCA